MGISSLNTALTGLSLAQRQINVISNNVANADTEGYSRKILPQYAQVIDGQGAGVLASNLIRRVDMNLSSTLWTQVSSVGENSVQATYLSRIEQFHGPPDSEISIASYISGLEDSFTALSDDPSNPLLLSQAVDQAVDTAEKINDFADYVSTLRNDAQNEIVTTVNEINNLIGQIQNINEQIVTDLNNGRSIASSEDLRDQAVKELSGLIEISFFIQGDGAMILQTNNGAELLGIEAHELTFNPSPVAADLFYPDSGSGVYIDDPDEPGSVNLTDASPGGKLGGLITLRDETFQKQMAQIDELAHKMATRFEAQGLLLFVDETGTIPGNTAPDLTTDPETAVPYVGFAQDIRVNQAILNDHTLLQSGTEISDSIEAGSNVVINRILNHTFGSISYQEAAGSLDLTVSGYAAPNNTLQDFLGVRSTNEVSGTRNLSTYADTATFINATNGSIDATSNTFRITLEEADLGLGPVNLDIDLSAVDAYGAATGSFGGDLVSYINNEYIPNVLAAGDQTVISDMGATFTLGSNGQLLVESTGDITFDATSPANAMGASNLSLLGFSANTYEAEDPYFDVAVGNNDFTRITIEPADDEASLLAKLQNVPGLAVQYGAGGELQLRPGNDYTDPEFGGELRIISGAFETSSASANTLIGAGTLPDGVNLVSALFGSFNSGPPVQNLNAVSSVEYGSEISASDTSTVGFRDEYLGPGANIRTNIPGATSLSDFAQKMINEHSQELLRLETRISDDQTFQDLLQDQLTNDSGVNMDEELSHLIVIQTAYSASARVLNAIKESFDELASIF